jgi:hypothetical protein
MTKPAISPGLKLWNSKTEAVSGNDVAIKIDHRL